MWKTHIPFILIINKHYWASHENKDLPTGLILRIIKFCIPKIALWFQLGEVISFLLCTAVLGSVTLVVVQLRDNCLSVVGKVLLCFICYIVKHFYMKIFIINIDILFYFLEWYSWEYVFTTSWGNKNKLNLQHGKYFITLIYIWYNQNKLCEQPRQI